MDVLCYSGGGYAAGSGFGLISVNLSRVSRHPLTRVVAMVAAGLPEDAYGHVSIVAGLTCTADGVDILGPCA